MPKTETGAPGVLTVNAQGGLANRMRSIASGVALATDTGARLRVIWQPTSEMAARFDELFEPSGILPRVEAMASSVYLLTEEMPRKRNLYASRLYQWMRYRMCLSDFNGKLRPFLHDPAALRAAVGRKGDVLIASGCEYYDTRTVDYSRLFRPNERVRGMVERITGAFDGNVHGMHIRRTDNRLAIEHSPLALFESHINSVIARDRDARFYVASDDCEVKRSLREKYGERLIMWDIPLTRATLEGTEYALAEMYALAATRSIAGSYWSSFSEIAARIGGIPLEILTN